MAFSLLVPSELIQQGPWGKGKHMLVTSCTFNGCASPCGPWQTKTIQNVLWASGSKSWWSRGWWAEATERARAGYSTIGQCAPTSAQGHAPGGHGVGCQGLFIREMTEKDRPQTL